MKYLTVYRIINTNIVWFIPKKTSKPLQYIIEIINSVYDTRLTINDLETIKVNENQIIRDINNPSYRGILKDEKFI